MKDLFLEMNSQRNHDIIACGWTGFTSSHNHFMLDENLAPGVENLEKVLTAH